MSITDVENAPSLVATAEPVPHELHARAILIRGVEKRLLDWQ